MVDNSILSSLIYYSKKLFYIISLLILTSIIVFFIYIFNLIYLDGKYEYYSYYTYNNVTITKVVRAREIKIYYGRFGKNDKKPNTYIYNLKYEIDKILYFHNDNKIYIFDDSSVLDNIGKDTNFVIMNSLDYTYFKKENNIYSKENSLIFNNVPIFYNKFEMIDNLKTGSKVKCEYELGKNNILDKIF